MDMQKIAQIKAEWISEKQRVTDRSAKSKPPFELPEISALRYTDPDFYAQEIQYVWNRTWLLAGYGSELPDVGSIKLIDHFPGGPIFLVRDSYNEIRAFYNACRHRGARLISDETAHGSLTCKYHSWCYTLEGKLNGVPDRPDFFADGLKNKDLIPIKCEQWGSFVFVNFDPAAQPLLTFLGDLTGELGDLPMDDYVLYKSFGFDIPSNWKCVNDAFCETYHIRFVHTNSVNKMLDSLQTARNIFPNGHGYNILKSRDAVGTNLFEGGFQLGDNPGHEITRTGQRSYNIFPNLTVVTTEAFFPIVSVWPCAVDRSRLRVDFLVNVAIPASQHATFDQALEMFRVVMTEDIYALDGMQAALNSNGVTSIVLGANERLIYNYHEQIDALIGPHQVSEKLRIEPYFRLSLVGNKNIRDGKEGDIS